MPKPKIYLRIKKAAVKFVIFISFMKTKKKLKFILKKSTN